VTNESQLSEKNPAKF